MTRQLTRARLDALQQADAFLASTSPDVARMELIDALEIARCRFALSDAELLYLRLAIRNVPQSHWGQGREPIFAWARIDVARVLGKCERTVHRIEAALVRKGLVVHRDGPRLQRWRRPDGTVIACVEKLKVMRENLAELRQCALDALEDAVLMGCDEAQVKEAFLAEIQALESGYPPAD